MLTRRLGRSDIAVSALGMGCWAIGGPAWRTDGKDTWPIGWGEVDDQESVQALRRARELGVTLFDTADVYGAGHSEEVVGEALEGCREEVVLATKFGNQFDAEKKMALGVEASPTYIRSACEASLRRLRTDYLDIYQFHAASYPLEEIGEVVETLEALVEEGKIRWYGWSTDDPERVAAFAAGEHCAVVQQRLNVFEGNEEILELCAQEDLASLNRSPLAMGVLAGKFSPESELPADDIRHTWDFTAGTHAEQLEKVEAIRGVLTRGGRSLVQGALGWIWARSPLSVPIPGFRTVAQVEENVGAAERGPLSESQMQEIAEFVG